MMHGCHPWAVRESRPSRKGDSHDHTFRDPGCSGQRLRLDGSTRALAQGAGLAQRVAQRAISQLMSNPTIIGHAMRNSHDHAAAISGHCRTRKQTQSRPSPLTLVLDVGGTHVKAQIAGMKEPIKIDSGPDMGPEQMLAALRKVLRGRNYDRVSIGFPAPVLHGRILHEPVNLGGGWVGFDFEAAFGVPVRVANDAAMQALGSYRGGCMLFLGLGTGLGTALIVDGRVEAMELAHLPYRKHDYEHYVGNAYRDKHKTKWRHNVLDIIALLRRALCPDTIVLGGGNVKHLDELPEGVERGANANAILGGFRLWEGTP